MECGLAGGRGEERTATCDVTVHVTDVNDNSPLWTRDATPSVVMVTQQTRMLTGARSAVGSVTATDPDEGINGTVRYSLRPGCSITQPTY